MIEKLNIRNSAKSFIERYTGAMERFNGRTSGEEIMQNYNQIIIPDNLNISELAKRVLVNGGPDDLSEIGGMLATTLELLIRTKAHYAGAVDKEGYVNLHITNVKLDFPAIDTFCFILEKQGVVLEKQVPQTKGKPALAYKLAPAYSLKGFKVITTEHPEVMITRYKLGLRSMSHFVMFPELFSHIVSSSFRVDIKGVMRYIRKYYNPVLFDNQNKEQILEDREKWEYRVLELAYKQLYFEVDEVTMEIYTSLAPFIARKALRPFVTYANKPLVEINIKESRLIIISIIFDYGFWCLEPGFTLFLKDLASPSEELTRLYSRNRTEGHQPSVSYQKYKRVLLTSKKIKAASLSSEAVEPQAVTLRQVTGHDQYLDSLYTTPMSSDTAKALVALFGLADNGRNGAEEVMKYKALVSGGNILDFLEKAYHAETGETIGVMGETQLTAPDLLFDPSFEDGYDEEVAFALQDTFAAEFPLISELFEWLKQYGRLLPNLAYKLQSLIHIGRVCERVVEEKPAVFIFPLMTVEPPICSIATTAGNEDAIKEVILEEVRKCTGVSCVLEVSHWSQGDSDA